MIKKEILFVCSAAFLLLTGSVYAAEEAPEEAVKYAKTELVKLGFDPDIIKAVQAANAKELSIDEIKETQEKWINTPGEADFMKPILYSECSEHLKELEEANEKLGELLVLDKRGAAVSMLEKEESYWCGEETGFLKAMEGIIHIDEVEFDESDQEFLVHVWIPIKANETVIGVLDIGLDLDDFDE